MSKRALLAVLVLAAAAPLYADFHSMERILTKRLGSPTYIPLFGLVRFGTWIVHPDGVHDIQLAVYEGSHKPLDGAEIEALVAREVPHGFTPMIRTRSFKSGEWTYIYAKPGDGDRIELFLVSHDHEDTVLMRLDVDAAKAGEHIGKKVMGKMASR